MPNRTVFVDIRPPLSEVGFLRKRQRVTLSSQPQTGIHAMDRHRGCSTCLRFFGLTRIFPRGVSPYGCALRLCQTFRTAFRFLHLRVDAIHLPASAFCCGFVQFVELRRILIESSCTVAVVCCIELHQQKRRIHIPLHIIAFRKLCNAFRKFLFAAAFLRVVKPTGSRGKGICLRYVSTLASGFH